MQKMYEYKRLKVANVIVKMKTLVLEGSWIGGERDKISRDQSDTISNICNNQ
jgi:hypothetical protein